MGSEGSLLCVKNIIDVFSRTNMLQCEFTENGGSHFSVMGTNVSDNPLDKGNRLLSDGFAYQYGP